MEQKFYSPLDIYLDNETDRPDVFTMVFTFSFSGNTPPRSLLLSRSPNDKPGTVWVQPDDEEHGFAAHDVKWSVDGLLLTIKLSGEDHFYWNESQSMTIELFETRIDGINSCLDSIFRAPVLDPPNQG